VHGEFQLPAHRLNETGRGDFVTVRVGHHYFDMRARLKRRYFQIDVHTLAIGIGFGGQGCDVSLGGGCSLQVVFGEEKFHGQDYNKFPLSG